MVRTTFGLMSKAMLKAFASNAMAKAAAIPARSRLRSLSGAATAGSALAEPTFIVIGL